MNISQYPDTTLMTTAKSILLTEGFDAFIELIRRKQAAQLRRAMTVVETYEVYRSQGRVHAYDAVLSLVNDIKNA